MLLTIARIALMGGFPLAQQTELRGEPLMHALQRGGFTVVLRHARTDRSFQEAVGSVPRLRSQQRNLNDDGVRDARLMGAVLAKYRIPFSEVVSSPMFRTLETADYAGQPVTDTTMVLRTFPPTDAQRALIAVEPRAGTNRLLVTHHFVIEEHIPGIRPGDIAESEAAVVRPVGEGRFELVGRILLEDWAALGGGTGSAASATPAAHGTPEMGAAPMVHGTAPMVWPASELGHLAKGYVSAFSSGDTAVMRRFLETQMEVGTQPMAVRVATYQRLFEEHGPLTVTTLESVTNVELRLLTKGRRSDIRVIVRRLDAASRRLASVTFQIQGGHP